MRDSFSKKRKNRVPFRHRSAVNLELAIVNNNLEGLEAIWPEPAHRQQSLQEVLCHRNYELFKHAITLRSSTAIGWMLQNITLQFLEEMLTSFIVPTPIKNSLILRLRGVRAPSLAIDLEIDELANGRVLEAIPCLSGERAFHSTQSMAFTLLSSQLITPLIKIIAKYIGDIPELCPPLHIEKVNAVLGAEYLVEALSKGVARRRI